MSKTAADYIAQGRAAFAAGTVCSNHLTSWQGKAEYKGWVMARDEKHATDLHAQMTRTTHACTLVNPAERRRDQQIDQMLDGYIEAMLWSSSDVIDGEDIESLEAYEVADKTLQQALATCTRFYDANRTDLAAYADLKKHAPEYGPYECIGHDLWLTTAGHGAGFWDRDMGRVGERLTAQCGYDKPFGHHDACIGDDGLVYLS